MKALTKLCKPHLHSMQCLCGAPVSNLLSQTEGL